MQSLSFFSFLLKEDKYTRSPRNVCAGGYGLNHRCPYNYLLLKKSIILFYKTDCKIGTTIKMPIILFYKTDCKPGTTIKMPIILFYKTDYKASTTTSSSKTSLLQGKVKETKLHIQGIFF